MAWLVAVPESLSLVVRILVPESDLAKHVPAGVRAQVWTAVCFDVVSD